MFTGQLAAKHLGILLERAGLCPLYVRHALGSAFLLNVPSFECRPEYKRGYAGEKAEKIFPRASSDG